MVDDYMAAGLNYFDTAYVYAGGKSEVEASTAIVARYPRESFMLATKLPAWCIKSFEDRDRIFNEQLERTQAGYFDFYLLHALMRSNYQKYDEFGIWDFVKEQKEKGLIKHYGFSFHGDPELLEELLTLHPDVDFIQLQINHADWEDPSVQARANWEVARKHGKSIVVMEPVKGGALADPIDQVKAVFTEANPNASYAS